MLRLCVHSRIRYCVNPESEYESLPTDDLIGSQESPARFLTHPPVSEMVLVVELPVSATKTFMPAVSPEIYRKCAKLAFEVLKCAGKYGVPYLYIECRQWIVQHFVEKFEDKEEVKTDALLYLQMVNEKLSNG